MDNEYEKLLTKLECRREKLFRERENLDSQLVCIDTICIELRVAMKIEKEKDNGL